MSGTVCCSFSSVFVILNILLCILFVKHSESQLIYESDKEDCDLRERIMKIEEENIRLRQEFERNKILVTFSATAKNDEKQTIRGPNEIVVYKNVLINVGNGYDPTTGIFTVPVSGNYVFFFAVEVQENKHLSIYLSVNNNIIAEALAGKIKDSFNTGSNMVSLFVRKNDRVFIRSHPGNSLTLDIRFTGNSFSGFLHSLT
ncbi:complement C1q-like protein 3 [Saccostrea cucullata]|uniref:complement C1q-like protein 3 n=1 Tax=Saccostrea cuccullata TaxID=36930 RepID=UPI002ED1BAC3